MNIALVGYRGTGKTTVARRLAQRLGWDWIDADDQIELRAGKSIAQIFADEGEGAFRDLENEVVADLARRDEVVLALGGGAVMREENRRNLAGASHVVWLRASAETIAQRIATDATTAGRRPNLTAAGGRREIEQLLAQRNPVYQQCAGLEVDTDDKSPEEVVREIAARLDLPPDTTDTA